MSAPVQWNGTQTEYSELLVAISRNCDCQRPMGVVLKKCGPHAMLDEQHALDLLVFGKRMSAALQEEEFCV